MKKIIIMVLAISCLALGGCKDKPNAQQASGPGGDTVAGRQMQPSAAHGEAGPAANPHAGMKPQDMAAANPHGGMRPQDIPVAADHKGKVISTMNASGYTYIEVEEKGKKLWVAVVEVKVKPGDEVEFPDSPPLDNFQSKTLNRTFDKIILAPAIRINGEPAQAGTHPKTG